MSRIQQHLPMLLALAHDRSESARMQLADKLSELFLGDDIQLTPHEEKLANELIDQLLRNDNVTVRHELVSKFADAFRLPRAVAKSLASDSIDIARNVLMHNEELTDEDLITVIETQSQDHATAIAARRSVNEVVADALVTTGDLRVMQIVAENLGAQLSPKALNILITASHLAESLQRPIVERPELTQEMASSLYWWVTQDVRRIVTQRFTISAGRLNTALAEAIEKKLEEHALDKHDDQAMVHVAEWLEDRKAVGPQVLPQILRLGHFRLFNIVMSRLSALGLPLVETIINAAGGRQLAALCRAIDIDKGNFISIFLLARGARPDEHVVHPRELSHAIAAFDRLSISVARDMLHSWKINPEYLTQNDNNFATVEA